MVPDASASDSDSSRANAPRTASVDATYDVVYRATRDAIWDVVGTATLMLFHIALAGLCFSLAFAGIGPFLGGSASAGAAGFGVFALAVGLFAASRVYSLATE